MSQENVEIVKRGWEAWIGGDFNGLFAIFDPEVVWDTSSFEGWPDEDAYYGHEGVRLFLEQWLGSWERYEAGVDEYLDIDDHRVLVLCWQRGLGARSHVPVEMD